MQPGSSPGGGFSTLTVRGLSGGSRHEMLSGLNFFEAAGMELKDGQPGRHFIIMEVATMGLLVLTRKQLETVIIDVDGEMIEVIIAEIRRDKVKLGIRASDKVQINRPEIREKKLKNAKKDGVS